MRTLEHAEVTAGLACNSWNNQVAWDGKDDAGKLVTAGVYTLRLHAVDAGGRTGDASVRLEVDPRIPGALTSPAAGETLAGLARFVFQPTSDFGLDEVQLSFDSGGSARIFNASPDGTWRTSMYTGDLEDGPTTLRMTVRSTDAFGTSHWWNGPTVPVVIDATGLPLTVVADPPAGPAPLATTFHLTTSDPQGRAVHYSVDFGDGTSPAGGEVAAPYPAVDVPHTYASPGAYRAVVTATNAAGAAATKLVEISATGAGNTAPDASLALDAASGSVPLPVKATIAGSDAERDPLTYTLDFGDGTTPVRGDLPQDPVGHTYDKVGTYVVRLAVSDGKLSTVKTATVVVGLDEPLAVDAGDDQVAVVGAAVHFDGSNSRPAAGIDAYHWTFGDGAAADGAAADHSYAAAGSYTATLTVTAGGHTEKDTAEVVVHPQTTQTGLVVSAKDEGGAPVPDTSLVVIAGSGQRYSATTDDRGDGVLQDLPDGSYTIYAWKQGYLPAKATGTVSGNAGSATVTLKAGQVATASLSSSPMTLDEVIAAGIDPTDPANQHVFEFTARLAFETSDIQMRGYTASGGFPLCPRVEGVEVSCGPSGASFTTESYHVSVSVNYAHNQPQLVWLVIPGKASWLKEFFSVQMMVSNLADPDFILDHGSATLAVPGGLALAPTAIQQQPQVAMGDIPGGQSATATWVLAGRHRGLLRPDRLLRRHPGALR